MAKRIVPFYTIATDYDQAGENALVASLEGQAMGALVIFNTTIGKTRIWDGTQFINAPMLNPDGGTWGGGSSKPSPVHVQALSFAPADGGTVYFGKLPKAPVATGGLSKVYVRSAGTIKRAEIYCYSGTAGSAEAWSVYIRKNNTTDTLIATVTANTNERIFSKTDLNISMAVGDYFEIKVVNPTWATNPNTAIFAGDIFIE